MKYNKILVTGASGFVGKSLVPELINRGYEVDFLGHHSADLTTEDGVKHLLNTSVDAIIHLAAKCGGIWANQQKPGEFFYDNMRMGINLIDAARRKGIKKFIQLGTVCSFPAYTPVPFKESDIYNGYPEPTNAPYGLAKRALLDMLVAYRKQYNFNGIYLIPTNMYGPHDHFNETTSHCIPAIILKLLNAKKSGDSAVKLWSDGSVSREFLFVKDACDGIIKALEYYDGHAPVNLAGGDEITIKDLALIIKSIIGYEGSIIWDTSKPSGQIRRKVDGSKALQEFGYEPKTYLYDGLKATIDWYLDSQRINNETGN
jgi:GDP-L-fucose synthase